jgi:hypothetical protein
LALFFFAFLIILCFCLHSFCSHIDADSFAANQVLSTKATSSSGAAVVNNKSSAAIAASSTSPPQQQQKPARNESTTTISVSKLAQDKSYKLVNASSRAIAEQVDADERGENDDEAQVKTDSNM